MPLDFPANPTNGQAYGSYIYNSTVGAWQSREDSRTVAILSSTVPASANPGDIWVNTNDGISFVYYDDGTSAQWMELLPSGVPLLSTKANIAGDTFTGNVTAPRFISNIATGTSPFGVTSTTVVTNLNADLLDGQHATAFSPVAGSSSIVTVGNVTSGKWQASPVDVIYGGTGTNTLTSGSYLKGNGTNGIISQTGIPAGDITSGTLDMARLPSGTIIQQVHYTYNTYVSGTGTAWTDIHSGTRPAITAKRSDSHFIILASMNWLQEGTRRQMIQLLRNGTVVAPNDIMIATAIASGWTQAQMFYQWKDTSARTAGTTYTFSFNTAVTAGTWYYNYNSGGITGTSMYSILEIVA